MLCAFSASVVIGFSLITRTPARSAASMYWWCVASTLVTTSNAIRSTLSISSKRAGGHRCAVRRPAASSMRLWNAIRTEFGSHNATTSYASRLARPSVNSWARLPVPTIAVRTGLGIQDPLLFDGAGQAVDEEPLQEHEGRDDRRE